MTEPPGEDPARRERIARELDLGTVGASLNRVFAGLRAPAVDVVEAVFSRWSEIVGPEVAANARPVSIDGDQLTVAVRDPAWASELSWLESKVVGRIAEVAGNTRITRLNVRVESHGKPGSDW